jgi:hypothetical protein
VALGGLSLGTFAAQAKRWMTTGVDQKQDDPVR